MVERSKGSVFARSRAGIVGLNPAGGTDVRLLWLACAVMYRSLRRADPRPEESYRLCGVS